MIYFISILLIVLGTIGLIAADKIVAASKWGNVTDEEQKSYIASRCIGFIVVGIIVLILKLFG